MKVPRILRPALGSLTGEWQPYAVLPADWSHYDELASIGAAECRIERVEKNGRPYGCRHHYRLPA